MPDLGDFGVFGELGLALEGGIEAHVRGRPWRVGAGIKHDLVRNRVGQRIDLASGFRRPRICVHAGATEVVAEARPHMMFRTAIAGDVPF